MLEPLDSGYLPPSYIPPTLNDSANPTSPFSRTLFQLSSNPNPPPPSSDYSSSDESQTSEEFELELQKQWKESMKTLETILFNVLLPYGVRIYGKKFSEFVYIRYLTMGSINTTEFWFGNKASKWLLSKGIGFARDFQR